ncbi:MAG: N-acetylmuramoyl-L-alanine amidase [Chloroflexota bacterium]|nr:N-acetylmuramoyl-L-alanine amidase [Chloroflexota bacterium]
MAKKRGAGRSSSKGSQQAREDVLRKLQRWLLLSLFVVIALVVLIVWFGGDDGRTAQWLEDWQRRPADMMTMHKRRIGIIVGHMDYDSGALCPDGLTEAETVNEIAGQVEKRLTQVGAQVDILAEYDDALNGYTADALVSIHADSCLDRSGFKVARSETSLSPDVEDRLVSCLIDEYQQATELAFDPHTITEDMTGYHAFNRVDDETPAAIIEVGFLGGDRQLLTEQPEIPAQGIANGIICFLRDP